MDECNSDSYIMFCSITAFELENISTNIETLCTEILSHYSSQIMQQFHVNVLGQEVLLNPYAINVVQNVS